MAAILFCWNTRSHADIITFEDKPLGPESFYNGGPNTNNNGWSSGGVQFSNSYSSNFGGFWSGFAYSNVTDNTTPGFGNQYASFAGGGSASPTYAVAYSDSARIRFATDVQVQSIDLTNTAYAALSIRDGDAFTTPFGGNDGNAPDFFNVTINGLDASGNVISQLSPFYLADYRFANNAQDYIVSQWTTTDLSTLGVIRGLGFVFDSSDKGAFGINTPTYFALDNIQFTSFTAVPEPSSLALLALGSVGAMAGYSRSRWLPRFNRSRNSTDA